MKKHLTAAKGFIMGMIFMALISGTVVMANPVAREIFFGVNVSLDGVPVNFAGDSQPFIMEGRTFLPLAALADTLGLTVNWNAETSTVELTTGQAAVQPPPPAAAAQSLLTAVPPEGVGQAGVNVNVTIGDRLFPNSLRMPATAATATFPLNGEFTRLSGYVGTNPSHAGGANRATNLRIFGDGILLWEHELTSADPAQPFSVDVTGVQSLVFAREFGAGTGSPHAILANPQIR